MIYKTMWSVYKRWLKADMRMAEAAQTRAAVKDNAEAALRYNQEFEILRQQLNRMNQIEEGYNV